MRHYNLPRHIDLEFVGYYYLDKGSCFKNGTNGKPEGVCKVKIVICSTLAGFSLFISAAVAAESIVGSVDKEGNVTFSDTVPGGAAEAEVITLDPNTAAPSDKTQSQLEAEQMIREAEESHRQRMEERDAEAAAAEERRRRIAEAEANLEMAKQVGPGDRLGTAGGGSRLTPEYHERVRRAEEELERVRAGN